MTVRGRLAVPLLLLVAACEPSTTQPDAGLALEIAFTHEGPLTIDAGTVRIRGAATRDISLAPGTERFVALQPGNYTVSLEALADGEVAAFAQRSATVVQGQVTTVAISPLSFIPAFTQVPSTAEVGTGFTLRWSSVTGAAGYLVEAALDPDFPETAEFDVTSTSITLTMDEEAVLFFRVRALTEFGSPGHPSATSDGTDVRGSGGTAPVVTQFGVEYLPVQGCPAGAVDFSTVGLLQYEDEDGDVPGGVLGSSDVEAEYRLSDQTNWTSFGSIGWDRASGDGHGGELVSAACWDAHDEQTHVDVRVRIRDAEGNWSDRAETRLPFPDAIQILPEGGTAGVPVGSGESLQFTATATFDGAPVPGDPIVWSSFNSPDLASIDDGGLYTLAAGSEGVDRIFARAVFTYADRGIQGPDAGAAGTWWAPCWEIPSFGLAYEGDWYRYRMRVHGGTEYRIDMVANGSGASGDPDLYLGFNSVPTLDDHVASGVSAGGDSVLWTAPADGVLWIGIYAYAPFTDYLFQVITPDDLCGAPGTTQYPPSPVSPVSPSGAVPRPGPIRPLHPGRRESSASPSAAPSSARGISRLIRDGGGR